MKHYFTGAPCRSGHLARRLVSNATCVECNRLHREKNPAQRREDHRRWRARNKKKIDAKWAAWHAANPEKVRAAKVKWDRQNPEKRRAGVLNRIARKRGAAGRYVASDISKIAKAQKNKCAYCRASLRRGKSTDHIIALSRGGSNWPQNLQLLCLPCNSSKGARDPLDHARSLGRLL